MDKEANGLGLVSNIIPIETSKSLGEDLSQTQSAGALFGDLTKPEADQMAVEPRKKGELYNILKSTPMDEVVATLISRPDGLNHLLMSDVDALLADIQTDFPDIAKVYSIGKSSGGRDINVLEISADQPKSNDKKPEEKNLVGMKDSSVGKTAEKTTKEQAP